MAIAIMCCYGTLGGRPEVEVRGLEQYFDGVAHELRRLSYTKWAVDRLVVCGGATGHDGEIEADVAAEEIGQRFRDSDGYKPMMILKEDRSLNAPQHFYRTVELLKDPAILRKYDLVVFCDTKRAFKIRVMAWRLLYYLGVNFWTQPRDRCRLKVIGVKRADTHPRSRWWRQSLVGAWWLLAGNAYIKQQLDQAVQSR